jgi:transposase InsO family protein
MLKLALGASSCDQVHVHHKPQLLSDDDSIGISADRTQWLGNQNMKHIRSAPNHPQTHGKMAA